MKSRSTRAAFRRARVRTKVFGTQNRPRLSVYRSSKHIYAQVVDDLQGVTLVSASSREKGFPKLKKSEAALKVGEVLAKKAVEKGIAAVVYDRNGRAYHGRVKAVAEGARKGGLNF